MAKHIGIYVRVSSNSQNIRSQLPDLQRWAASAELPVKWYEDKLTGTRMHREGWNKLHAAIQAGHVSTAVIWRMDRLGRTASGLTALFDELRERKVNLVSLKDGFDLSNAAGRLMANMLASVAQYETEVRGERVRAGIDAAHAAGKRWGGSESGVRKKVSPELELAVKELHAKKTPVTSIARALKLSRGTIYSILRSR